LQDGAVDWRVLEVLQLRTGVRHFSDRRSLSQLPYSIPVYAMPGLRPSACHESMGGCISGSVEFRNRREINPFYAAHQHFRLADVFATRYASDFQALLKPAISTSRTRFA
jgi:hypothetical protein